MAHARPEYLITVAIVGVLAAIGVPRLASGRIVSGSLFVGLAAAVAIWAILAFIRERRPLE
jgi:hypothetical protein